MRLGIDDDGGTQRRVPISRLREDGAVEERGLNQWPGLGAALQKHECRGTRR
jgi:hypothetical protein